MGQAKDQHLRQQIALARQQGGSYTSLCEQFGVSYNTVREICIRYAEFKEQGLVPRYFNCGRSQTDGAERSFRLVRLIRHLHPGWGVGYILVRIRRDYPDLLLQSERHYQRRLADHSDTLPKPKLPAPPPIERSRKAHDGWQIDAKERIDMPDGEECCFLNITDEKTAALLKTKVFSPGANL